MVISGDADEDVKETDVPLTSSEQETETAVSTLASSSSVPVATGVLLANVFSPSSTVTVTELPMTSLGTSLKRKFEVTVMSCGLLRVGEVSSSGDGGVPSSATSAVGGVRAPTPRLDLQQKFGPLFRAELGDEFLSFNLELLGITTKQSLDLSLFVRVEVLAEMTYRTAFVAFLNGTAMSTKFGAQFQAPFQNRAECATVAAATEEIVRLREVLKFHGFPQRRPTKLRVSMQVHQLLSPTAKVDRGWQFAESHKIVQDQIDLGQVTLYVSSDFLLETAFTTRHLKASSVKKDPPN